MFKVICIKGYNEGFPFDDDVILKKGDIYDVLSIKKYGDDCTLYKLKKETWYNSVFFLLLDEYRDNKITILLNE